MKIWSKSKVADSVVGSRKKFDYMYRGYEISIKPTGLKNSGVLGEFSAYIDLSHEESMSLPYEIKTSAYGDDIGDVCVTAERYLDKIIDFLLADADNRAACLKKLNAFAAKDARFK